ncbi:unnamed protein product [Effrenium voratum]|uniref:Cation/H+ exchanger transmembrane domain-containing protein n=1 Tax=Effrenium voratum TaxID=2562239 RepID=A0AA36MXK7_9DINO|nr:unnamed protein product [Effrenium voratum]
MGGASSFLAMLGIAGFLGAAWTASKVSRLLGISSIVLEIVVGVALGPRGFGVVSPVYTVCETKRWDDCGGPEDLDDRIANGLPLGATLGRIASMDLCHAADYDHGHGHVNGHGLFNVTVDYVGGATPVVSEELHGDTDHSADHSADDHSADHSADTADHSADTADHSGGHRRLSGGHYSSYKECLIKECEHEVDNQCGSFPDFFTLIGHAGVGLMIFESGMHFDFEKAKIVGPPACCVAVLGTILPLIFGTLLTMAFGRPFMPDGISAGTALAPTSVGIALRLLGEAGVLQENFGQAIITAAFVDDILSLVLFNVLFSLGGEFDAFKTIYAPIIGIAFMGFACVLAVKFWPFFLKNYILAKVPKKAEGAKISAADEALFLFMFALLFVYATITHFLGTHLWGCFIAGMSFACLDPPHHAHHVWVKQTKRLTSWMIRLVLASHEEASLLSLGLDRRHEERLLRCASAPPGDKGCWDTPAPPEFEVFLRLADGRGFRVHVNTSWAPVFAQRFWQLSKLRWWEDVPIYRNDYVNTTERFMSQFGLVGAPRVNQAWTAHKTSNQTAPALVSNTRGRVSFAMDAVVCQQGGDDPCAPYRPNCTAADYCAVGYTTEIFVNYGDNSRLDPHGFAPFGEVRDMDTLDDVGKTLGRMYGEVQELCDSPSPYCVFRNGKCRGVNVSTFQAKGHWYIMSGFPIMYALRIADVKTV